MDGLNGLDLYAGVGGWDLAGQALGIHFLGVEIDKHACATRAAARLITHQEDITDIFAEQIPPGEVLVASPPCQFFSRSRGQRPVVSQSDFNRERRTKWRDYAAKGPDLLLQPMRWARHWKPTFIAFEQVRAVLPVWDQFAQHLQTWGYHTWTGLLNAADYGVPQNRVRAILMASRLSPVSPPPPQPRASVIHPTIVCNRRSAGGIVVGRSLKQGGIRMTFAQAGCVQGFPLDYPWQGSVEQKSRQIGNAIPPPFAKAILQSLVD